jgi:hypothetical protein
LVKKLDHQNSPTALRKSIAGHFKANNFSELLDTFWQNSKTGGFSAESILWFYPFFFFEHQLDNPRPLDLIPACGKL